MLVSFVHSIKMCFIVYWFPHWHLGGGLSFRMKEWINLVCPMHNRARVVSSLLVLFGSSFLSFKIGCTWKSLLWGFFSHNRWHFFVIICLIFSLRSVYGILKKNFLLGTILRAASAHESTLLFPWISTWLGIQQNITFLLWFMEMSLFRSLTMKGLSSFVFLRDHRTEMESEWMMNFSLLLVETYLSAKFIAQILEENMEASLGGIFSRFSCQELFHIRFHCCFWSHPWECVSDRDIFPECCLVSLGRLGDEFYF